MSPRNALSYGRSSADPTNSMFSFLRSGGYCFEPIMFLKVMSHILDVVFSKTFSADKSLRKKFLKIQHLRCETEPLFQFIWIARNFDCFGAAKLNVPSIPLQQLASNFINSRGSLPISRLPAEFTQQIPVIRKSVNDDGN